MFIPCLVSFVLFEELVVGLDCDFFNWSSHFDQILPWWYLCQTFDRIEGYLHWNPYLGLYHIDFYNCWSFH